MRQPTVTAVYSILNLENQRHYVGSAVCLRKRTNAHKSTLRNGIHCNPKLQRAWDKHGEGAFRFDILEVVEDKTLLIEREQWWIDNTRPFYNHARVAGSAIGTKRTPEQCERISASTRGKKRRPLSDKEKLALSVALTGRKHSAETKQKIGDRHRGKKKSPMAQSARLKLSAALRGRGPAAVTRAAISESNRTRVWTPEMRAKMSASKRKTGQPAAVKLESVPTPMKEAA